MLEPVTAAQRAHRRRETFCWQRGETTASAGQLFDFNGMNAKALEQRALALLGN